MKMRPSRILAKLRAGEIAASFKLNLADSRAASIAAMSGFDCIWLDMEHTANDYSVIEGQIMAALCHNVDTVVRVPRGCYSDYIRPLELDAAGIMVPHITGYEDAARVIQMTRFPPIGQRAVDGGNADGAFCGIGLTEYLQQANEQRFIILQIEDPEAMEELDAIAALSGYDVLFFGPGDFSCRIGVPGESNHPMVKDARRRIADTATRHGKFAGTVASAANMNELISMGYRFISAGADVVGLAGYCAEMRALFGR